MNHTPFIMCKQVVKAYRVGEHEIVALRGIDFQMEKGEMVAIIGPSGAGKSSLLNLLGGLDNPTAGQLVVDGQNLLDLKGRHLSYYRLTKIGFIWQQVDRNLIVHRNALGNVTLPMMLAGVPIWERRRRARDLLSAVGLDGFAQARSEQLSGGQQQRVAIAVALANRPQLLLADEITGSLDRDSAVQVMDLLMRLREQYGLTILMVTHDMDIARYADRILTLRDGALGEDLSHLGAVGPTLDNQGRIQLPDAVRQQLLEAGRIAVEVRPEGVLLRPEIDIEDDAEALLQDMIPQDSPPQKRRGFLARLMGRLRRKGGA